MREFSDIGSFVAHLAVIEAAVHMQSEHGLKKSAGLIEHAAKESLGTYQPEVGPFPAWSPLADATKAERERLGFTPDDPLLRDGELIRDSIKHEVAGADAVIGSPEEVAAYQEFGTNKIPPRPFMGPLVITKKKEVEAIMGKALLCALVGGNLISDNGIGE